MISCATIKVMRTPIGKSKGAAVVVFQEKNDKEKALLLNGKVELEKRTIEIRDFFAQRPVDVKPPTAGDGEAGEQGEGGGNATSKEDKEKKSVIVKNLAFTANEANIGEFFSGVGEIDSVRIAKDKATGRAKGFAIVVFSHDGAVGRAVQRSGRMIKDRPVKVEVLGGGPVPEAPAVDTGGVLGEMPATTSSSSSSSGAAAAAANENGAEADGAKPPGSPKQGANGGGGGGLKNMFIAAAKNTEDKVETFAQFLEVAKKSNASTQEEFQQYITEKLENGPDRLKAWLSAVGVKAGGTPEERCERGWRAMQHGSLAECPKEIVGKANFKKAKLEPPAAALKEANN